MAALVEGQQYALSSSLSTSAGLSLTHVKLTDSALKAFEEFLKIKDATSRRPSIQFNNANSGEIRIPVRKGGENGDGFHKFTFSLSTPMLDPKSSFDCVQQASSSGGEPLRSLGTMSHKMSVQATDDVYEKTREQMRIAEEDAKKNRAQEIKMNERRGHKVIKRVLKKPEGHGSSKPVSHSPHVSRTPTSVSIKKPANSQSPALQPQHRPSHSPSYKPHTSPAPSAPSVPSITGKSSPNNTIMALPYRDRVIHLLALRQYKKPELIYRLQKDGIPEKHKNSLSSILQEVGQLTRDNSYMLRKHLYTEVRSDWAAYTDQDRELLKRRLQQLESSASAGNSPALSPAHSNSSQGSSPSSSHKRPTSTTDEDPHLAKKQRVAHDVKRPSPSYKMPSPSTTQHSPSVSTTTPDSTSFTRPSQSPVNSIPSPNKTPTDKSTLSLSSKPQVLADLRHRNNGSSKEEKASDASKGNHKHNSRPSQPEKVPAKNPTKSLASSTSEIPDYVLKFTEITGGEQRQKYKAVFNSEYEEYRQLHSEVEKVTRKFKDLEAALRKHDEGTTEYEKIKNDIINQYRIVKKDTSYVNNRKRCDYLHRKLAHIKKLILDYDNLPQIS